MVALHGKWDLDYTGGAGLTLDAAGWVDLQDLLDALESGPGPR